MDHFSLDMKKKKEKTQFQKCIDWCFESMLHPYVTTLILSSTSVVVRYLLDKFFDVQILRNWLEIKTVEVEK